MSCAAPPSYDEAPLASLSLTHVSYDPSDPVSLFAAYLSLLPQALMIVYVVLIYAQRELEIILALAGQLGCEAINYVLKRVIKEARPTNLKGKGYGMPSSHAQFMFFFATYIGLWICVRNTYLPKVQKTGALAALWAVAASVASSRVYLQYHTPKQVLVGVSAGVVIGVLWFIATALLKVLAGGVIWDLLLENPISKMIYVRDECAQVDVQYKGWEIWWAERIQKKQAAQSKKVH